MQNVLFGVAALACPIGMGAMMWFMAKGMRSKDAPAAGDSVADLDMLREERRRLGEQIERLDDGDAVPVRRGERVHP